ncbi:MAG: VTT domain-containing protein [Actinomycetota bacterium]|nr:VTT domain-containing protein [Actinomycetota bacterium]
MSEEPSAGVRRVPLPILVTPIVILSLLGTIADVIGPGLINERPLLQMFLNPRNRYLLLASPQVDAVPFLVVGFTRLVLTDPLFYLLGAQYGEGALRWAERKLGDTGFVAGLQRFFARFGSLIVLLAPSGYVCLLAGAAGMSVRRFVTLNVTGTLGRLLLFRFLGETFKDELFAVLGFIQRYQWWLIGLSFVVVVLQSRRKGDAGTARPPSEIEAELEAEIDAAGQEPAAGDGPAPSDDRR